MQWHLSLLPSPWGCSEGGDPFKFENPTGCDNFSGFGGGEGGRGGGGVGLAGQPLGSLEGGQWVPRHTYLNMILIAR